MTGQPLAVPFAHVCLHEPRCVAFSPCQGWHPHNGRGRGHIPSALLEHAASRRCSGFWITLLSMLAATSQVVQVPAQRTSGPETDNERADRLLEESVWREMELAETARVPGGPGWGYAVRARVSSPVSRQLKGDYQVRQVPGQRE